MSDSSWVYLLIFMAFFLLFSFLSLFSIRVFFLSPLLLHDMKFFSLVF